jgi:hypothetical protein
MTRTLLLAFLSLVLTFVPARDGRADLTYNIQSYGSLQMGYSLTGTITTDGTIGALASTDIIAWTYTISTSGILTPDTESSTAPGSFADITGSGALLASATELTMPFPAQVTYDQLLLGTTGHGFIAWARNSIDPPGQPHDLYIAQRQLPEFDLFWDAEAPYPPGIGGANWIIAQAPEPDTLTVAMLTCACIAVVEWTRRRRRVASSSQASPTANS